MRLSARLTLAVLALALGACSWLPKKTKTEETPATPQVVQRGPLKVHPGLLGMAVPPELQVKEEPKLAAAEPATPPTPAKPADAELLAKRAVHFDLKSAEIKPEYNEVLAAHARRLAKNPEARLRVEGNADERGTDGLNKRLGQQRADAVKAALTGSGASDKQIATVSYGKKKPKAVGHDEESWAENRRADLVYEREE